MSPIESFRVKDFSPGDKPECVHGESFDSDFAVRLERILNDEYGILEHHGLDNEVDGIWGDLYITGRNNNDAQAVYSFLKIPDGWFEGQEERGLDFDEIEDFDLVKIAAPGDILTRIKELLPGNEPST